ncbi:unnamed protein product [Alternaria sp. RS040]
MAYQQLSKMQHAVEVTPVNEDYTPPSSTLQNYEEIHDFDFSPTSPRSTVKSPSIKKHVPHWSSSTNILAVVVGLGAVASIIGVVSKYNGRALPDWPHDITLNALIALLATFANAAMSVCLSSGISQAKWIRFKQASAPLSDMEAFDDASRGSWGSIKLLGTARGGFLGSFGATVAVVALALGPFSQQIATYKVRSVESDIGATIPRALNFTPALAGNTSTTGFVPILPLKAAVYNGLAKVVPVSGNPSRHSLFVMNALISALSLRGIVRLNWVHRQTCLLAGGKFHQEHIVINTSSDVFSMTSFIPSAYGDMPHSTMIRLIFMGTELQDTPDKLNPWASQCSLQACANTLSASVTNGTHQENITRSVLNHTVIDMSSPDPGADYGVYIAGDTDDTAYLLGMEALLSIRGWFSAIFTNGSATRTTSDFTLSVTDPDRAVVVNLTVGISSGETFFDTDIVTAFYWNYYEYADGINMLMSDLAISMTTAFRGFNGAVETNGKSITVESYVHVRWGFAVLPIAAVVATLVFLLAAMTMTHTSGTQVWKSSALVSFLHGLDHQTKERFDTNDSLAAKKKQAKAVKVKLYTDDRDNSILGVEKAAC